jgi:putative transposase
VQDFSKPGKPKDCPLIKPLNGGLRDECLNVDHFISLEDTHLEIENCGQDNGDLKLYPWFVGAPPAMFVKKFEITQNC